MGMLSNWLHGNQICMKTTIEEKEASYAQKKQQTIPTNEQ